MVHPLLVGIPTHDSRVVVHSMVELTNLANCLEGGIDIFTAEGGNIPRTRNMVMDQIRRVTPKGEDPVWVLWLDSDILLPAGSAAIIAQYVQEGRESMRAWLAHYHMANGQSVLMKDRTLYRARHYTHEELTTLPDWAEIGMGGFGLAYLPMALDYKFHADAAGEDINYFLDHPDLTVHLAKSIVLKHRKPVWV